MSVPTKRRTGSQKRRRRSHFALKKQSLAVCSQCGKAILQHTACSYCGYYKGRLVLKVKSQKSLKSKKEKKH
ncbi:50S ribosomal protein L32 [Candidatus Falkowbacteria bacterium CG10_big_fil_rev_8_21_14_0_10_43_11]|uniref:Large ribosomal subunit protein bL32 n=1 Tax=Candidatus Falkowbacteria bacterium CG10_big_fil_rev_8_21_14_0_10_43_11 TaxID=1974568 RepID=A0A2M6WLP1_9BACT|nr:MAG: 50S ribosomal protein L32 [Candidatus Falkowbacteria bacterium CG10_big_fil_rev_8_21_14_0_10_43_11]